MCVWPRGREGNGKDIAMGRPSLARTSFSLWLVLTDVHVGKREKMVRSTAPKGKLRLPEQRGLTEEGCQPLFSFLCFCTAWIPLSKHIILSTARNHPRGQKLDSPRRPRRRGEQRSNLPWCNQLAKSRWAAHVEQSFLFVFFLHRGTGNTSGAEALFSNRGKSKGKVTWLSLHWTSNDEKEGADLLCTGSVNGVCHPGAFRCGCCGTWGSVQRCHEPRVTLRGLTVSSASLRLHAAQLLERDKHSGLQNVSTQPLLDPVQKSLDFEYHKKRKQREDTPKARRHIKHRDTGSRPAVITCKLLTWVCFAAGPEFAGGPFPGTALALEGCSLASLMRYNFGFLSFLGDFTFSVTAFELFASQNSLVLGVNDTMILFPKTSSFSIRFCARSALSWFVKRRVAVQPLMLSTFPPQLSDRRLSLLLMLLPSLFAGRL